MSLYVEGGLNQPGRLSIIDNSMEYAATSKADCLSWSYEGYFKVHIYPNSYYTVSLYLL